MEDCKSYQIIFLFTQWKKLYEREQSPCEEVREELVYNASTDRS